MLSPIGKTRLQMAESRSCHRRGPASWPTETARLGPDHHRRADIELPDLLTDLQDKTQLTRRSIARILTAQRATRRFQAEPPTLHRAGGRAINRVKRLAIVDGIKYRAASATRSIMRKNSSKPEELTGYLKNMLEVTRSVYEHVVYDSAGVERTFAEQLEKNEAVKVYAKLPGWFRVPTPLGPYNPDWAILVE